MGEFDHQTQSADKEKYSEQRILIALLLDLLLQLLPNLIRSLYFGKKLMLLHRCGVKVFCGRFDV